MEKFGTAVCGAFLLSVSHEQIKEHLYDEKSTLEIVFFFLFCAILTIHKPVKLKH